MLKDEAGGRRDLKMAKWIGEAVSASKRHRQQIWKAIMLIDAMFDSQIDRTWSRSSSKHPGKIRDAALPSNLFARAS